MTYLEHTSFDKQQKSPKNTLLSKIKVVIVTRRLMWNFICTRVGVKYSWPSTQVHQVPQIYTKYKYWPSTHFFKKYLSTSSTFISSTSTSTHIKICSKVRMDMHTDESKFWMDKIKGLSPNHVCSSEDGHILCRVDFGWTN